MLLMHSLLNCSHSNLLMRTIYPIRSSLRYHSVDGNACLWEGVVKRLEDTIANQKVTKKPFRYSYELKRISQVSAFLSKRMLQTKSNNDKVFPVYKEHYFYCIIDALVSLGKLNTAWDLVVSCQREDIKLCTDAINCLLWGLIEPSKGKKTDTYLKLWEFVKRNDSLTFDGFASKVFYHSKHSELDNVRHTLEFMRKSGLEPSQLVKGSKLTDTQVAVITKTLAKVEPELKQTSIPQEFIVPDLLKHLYRGEDNVGVKGGVECISEIISPQDLAERLREQLEMERVGYLDIPSIVSRKKKPKNLTTQLMQESKYDQFQDTLKVWTSELSKAICERQNELIRELDLPRGGSGRTGPVSPNRNMFLCLLPAQILAEILIHNVALPVLSRGGYGVYAYSLVQDIGRAAWVSYVTKKKDSTHLHSRLVEVYSEYVKLFTDPSLAAKYSPREYWNSLMKRHLNSLDLPYPRWTRMVTDPFSFYLLYLLVNKLSMPTTNPAQNMSNVKPFFYAPPAPHSDKKGVPSMIVPNKDMQRLYSVVNSNRPENIRLSAGTIPLLVPPKPWCSTNDGGLLISPTSLVINNEDTKLHEISLKNEKLMGVYDALNILGNCPWKINQPILDLVIEVFSKGGSDHLGVAVESIKPPVGPEWDPGLTPSEYRKERLLHRQEIKGSMEAYSLYAYTLYRLSVANLIRDKVFWMPHFLDFRGRAYAFSSTVSHMGDDPQRGILKFAIGKPLGPRGLDWLKIHAINLTGLYKRSPLHGRLSAADSLMDEILDSADRPTDGRGWWKEADEPWQALATCKEIRQALDSGDPEKFVSHIPIHQDGSCNGLQHYAALGGDPEGAANVNLSPASFPADVYSEVAMHVEKFRAKDAENDVQNAKMLEGLITRRVVKQSVMTEVYGVTFVGAREQVETQLAETTDWSKKELSGISSYVVKLMFKAMREMFENAKTIQGWLTKCATLISKYEPIEWETPLGLLCIQPYHKVVSSKIATELQKSVRIIQNSELTRKPDVVKQRNGFPPNFVHSLDSCHMMLTSLNCHKEGVTFVAIHDCYWTHAATVEEMGSILREQFIRLHSEPILKNLSEHLVAVFGHKLKDVDLEHLKDIPVKGAFDINEVLKSKYFFS